MKRWTMAAIAATTMALAPLAHAEPTPEQKRAQAEALNEEGKTLAHAKQFAAARAKFLQAYAMNPVPGPLFNAARMEHLLGEYADALPLYRTYLALPPSEKVSNEMRKDAETFAAECEAKVCHVDVKGSTSFTVDGKPRPAPLVMNPGNHSVEMEGADGRRTTTVTCVAGGKHVVDYAPKVETPIAPPSTRTERGSWLVPGVLAGVGVVGLGVGIATGLASSSASTDGAAAFRGGACADLASAACKSAQDQESTASSMKTASIVGYVVGGGFLAAAVVSAIVIAPWKVETKTASVRVSPGVGSLSFAGTF